MKRGAGIVFTLFLIVTAICCALLWPAPGGPLYRGRRTVDWVEQALREESRSEAFEAVLKIGTPALPYIARQGLHNKYHKFYFLSDDYVAGLCGHHLALFRCVRIVPWINYDACAARHDQARWLLSCMGTNAQAAIPDVIDCLEHCRGLHFYEAMELLDTLGQISGTNTAAIPYLTTRARRDGSLCLRAAALAYYIDGRTNLMVETCQRLAQKHLDLLLDGQELFWFREDHELNEHVVPLLEKLYVDPRLSSSDQESVMLELESRTNDATAAIARLLARQTNAPLHVN